MLKDFDTTVSIASPINFAADKERHLLIQLQKEYGGRCWKGAYIKKILSIVSAGSIGIERTNTSGRGVVDVRFRAEVMIFSAWDILVGVVRVPTYKEILICDYASKGVKAVITLTVSKETEAIGLGQKFPARVIIADHAPMRENVNLIATLLTCDKKASTYQVSGSLEPSVKDEFEPLVESIEEELVKRQGLDKEQIWFHERLLYAYQQQETKGGSLIEAWKGGLEWEGPETVLVPELSEGTETVSVIQLARRVIKGETVDVTGVWSRSLDLYRSSPHVRKTTRPDSMPAGWEDPADVPPRAAFAMFLKNILDFLVCIREMVELYNNREIIDSSANLWAVMRAAQRRN